MVMPGKIETASQERRVVAMFAKLPVVIDMVMPVSVNSLVSAMLIDHTTLD